MKLVFPILMLFVSVALAWQCPACGEENDGSFCVRCHLPEPPEGMAYVPPTTVEIDDSTYNVPAFFIDLEPVSYREFLYWLNDADFSIDELGTVITGDGDGSMQFLAFTPFAGDPAGGITVSSQCLESPVASITWVGAQSFLSTVGKRLPTLAELKAAASHGLIETEDSYEALLAFSDQIRATLGSLLGSLASQAMFAGYSSANERKMWEFTGTPYGGNPLATSVPSDVKYVTLFKALENPVLSSTGREMGYFNVIFRGAIGLPR